MAVVAMMVVVGPGLQPASAYQRPGITELVSVASDGTQAEYSLLDVLAPCEPQPFDGNYSGDLTTDGRYVAFHSAAPNLVPGDSNKACDVFVHDRKKKETVRVSIASDGVQGLGVSGWPSVSSSGRYIAFDSTAPNIVPGDTNGTSDIFVHDRLNGSTARVSVSSTGEEGSSSTPFGSRMPSISASGRHVAFDSHFDNLVEDDTNNNGDVFVHDRKTKKTVRASVDSDGNQSVRPSPGGGCFLEIEPIICIPFLLVSFLPMHPNISKDGRVVSFSSDASDLVSDDTNVNYGNVTGWDVFAHDLRSGKTELISVASDGTQQSCLSPLCTRTSFGVSAISATGRYITFTSGASDLVPNDGNQIPPNGLILTRGHDAFVHDRKSGRTERVSVTSYGEERYPNGGIQPKISANGRYVVWISHSEDDGFTAEHLEVYVHDREVGSVDWVSRAANGERSQGSRGSQGEGCGGVTNSDSTWSTNGAVGDGGHIVFYSCNPDLVPGDTNNAADLFVRDMGPEVGVGGFGGQAPDDDEEDDDDQVCIGDVCIPPLASVTFEDELDDVDEAVGKRGANLIGGRITYRSPLDDLYTVLELESMPRTPALAAATTGLVYGMSFDVDGKSYEVRVASTGLGSHGETTAAFGLFSCPPGELLCFEVADLKGGFGTTGERIVFSVPLDDLGIEDGSMISDVTAFTAIGTFMSSEAEVIDEATIGSGVGPAGRK